jgi:hypothetical protein
MAGMIICKNPHPDYPDDWIIVKQSDHDDHAGFIAAHWQWERFWQSWDARLLTIAVGMHDTGSACWEDYASIDGRGMPWKFSTIRADDHIELHMRGVREACNVHPYVGLLVSMHVVGIHRDRLHIDPTPGQWYIPEADTPKVKAFIAEQTALQHQLRADLQQHHGAALSDEALMNDFKLFEVVDILSTQFSVAGLRDREMCYVPDANGQPFMLSLKRAGEWEFKVEPFPFAGDHFDCPCIARRVPKRVYANDNDFREAWYTAPPVVLPYACVR